MREKEKAWWIVLAVALSLLFVVGSVSADSSYDEAIDGDLSDDRFNPTSLVFSPGVNRITSSSVAGDRDYFTVHIPTGLQLYALILTDFVSVDDVAFVAVQAGTTFTEPPDAADPANILGYMHHGAAHVGTDILDDIGMGAGAIGFTPPLTSGNYTFWSQETGPDSATYTFEFVVLPATNSAAWDESADGDLSDDRFNPSVIPIVAGGNLIDSASGNLDREYFTMNIPDGHELSGIILESYSGGDGTAFIGVQQGTTFTEPPDSADPANLLGYAHFGTDFDQVGTSILEEIGEGAGSIGFIPPLASGDYVFWMQQASAETSTILIFVVTPIEPMAVSLNAIQTDTIWQSNLLLLLLALLTLTTVISRRQHAITFSK